MPGIEEFNSVSTKMELSRGREISQEIREEKGIDEDELVFIERSFNPQPRVNFTPVRNNDFVDFLVERIKENRGKEVLYQPLE